MGENLYVRRPVVEFPGHLRSSGNFYPEYHVTKPYPRSCLGFVGQSTSLVLQAGGVLGTSAMYLPPFIGRAYC